MNETCKQLDIKLHLSHVKNTVLENMNRLNEIKLDPENIYLTNHDAVLAICDQYYQINNKDDGKTNELLNKSLRLIQFDQTNIQTSPV